MVHVSPLSAPAARFPDRLWDLRSGLFSAEDCARIVALALPDGEGAVGHLVDRQDHAAIRRSTLGWLNEADPEAAWVHDRLLATVAEANRETFDFALTEFAERAQVARYDAAGLGHYDWHSDIGASALARKRKLTLVVQLSDPAAYEGGDLQVNADGHERTVPREQGTAVLFPSFAVHRVAPVTAGVRYSLALWVHGPGFR